MDGEGLGFKFWGGLVGSIVLIGIVGAILFLIFARLAFTLGFLGVLIVFGAVLIGIAWFYDRRSQRRVGYDS
jgi:hypothetical protein